MSYEMYVEFLFTETMKNVMYDLVTAACQKISHNGL